MRYLGQPSFILGFHGCDSEVASAVINGKGHLLESRNSHDWLGHGIYFWENDPERALKWAENRMKRPDSRIKNPDVVGAIIDLGYCLSLLESTHIRLIEAAYSVLKERHDSKGTKMPVNTGGDDLFRRDLDCAVIQTLAEIQSSQGRGFDTVRGLFREGSEPYPTAGFRKGNHIQVCVRNHEAIKGYFSPSFLTRIWLPSEQAPTNRTLPLGVRTLPFGVRTLPLGVRRQILTHG